MIKKKLVTVGLAMVLAMASSVVAFAAPMETSVAVEQSVRLEAKLDAEDVQILSQLFDANFFAKRYPSVAKALNNDTEAMFKYFCTWGVYEGKRCCADFDVVAYAMAYPDLAKVFGTDVMKYYHHYVSNGRTEGRVFTTVEECRKNGIDTKIMESQRFILDENGCPAFAKFFNIELGSFVYNEEEAKTILAGTYSEYDTMNKSASSVTTASSSSSVSSSSSSDDVSPESKKDEPTKLGFNTEAYERDMKIWESKQPDIKDYIKDGVAEKLEADIAKWESKEPTIDSIKKGRVFSTEQEALAAYESEHAAWVASEPQIEEYVTDAELAKFTQDTQNWNESQPKAQDYVYNKYESQDAADEAFSSDYSAWEARLTAWLFSNDKGDYSVGYADSATAEKAYQQALFDFTTQIYNIDYNTQYKSKTKNEVANEKMVEAYAEYMAEWTPWNIEKLDKLGAWKIQNPDATIDEEQDWTQSYLSEHPEPVKPTLDEIKAGLVKGTDYTYENEVDASAAYRQKVNHEMPDAKREQGAPQQNQYRVGKYSSQDEADAAQLADREEYRGTVEELPNMNDYSYDPNAYENEQSAESAFNKDKSDWADAEPLLIDYANEEEYLAAYEEWEASEPKLNDGYYEVSENAEHGDEDFESVTYIKSEEDSEYYIDDKHYANAPTEEELLDVLIYEWIEEMPIPEEEDWKEDGKEQYNDNCEDWVYHAPEGEQYEEGSDGNWEGCPDYEYVEPNEPTPPEPTGL